MHRWFLIAVFLTTATATDARPFSMWDTKDAMICNIEADGYWHISHDFYRREMDMKACDREDTMRKHIKPAFPR